MPPFEGRHLFVKIIVGALGHIALSHETGLAQNWLSAFFHWTWLERDLASGATLGTHCVVHFAHATAIRLASGTASLAALWGAQALAGIEFLFTVCERK